METHETSGSSCKPRYKLETVWGRGLYIRGGNGGGREYQHLSFGGKNEKGEGGKCNGKEKKGERKRKKGGRKRGNGKYKAKKGLIGVEKGRVARGGKILFSKRGG